MIAELICCVMSERVSVLGVGGAKTVDGEWYGLAAAAAATA